MKRKPTIIAIAAGVFVAVLIWQPWRPLFSYHFDFPLPSTAKYLNHHHSRGIDSGDEFEFAFTDNQLRDAIIRQWNLQPAVDPNGARSFARLTSTEPWWPGARLDQLPERYGRIDEATARYWSLWVDRANGKVYVESGEW
jgi:hypothetical protein